MGGELDKSIVIQPTRILGDGVGGSRHVF